MAVYIGTSDITGSGSGINFNTNFKFNSSGFGAITTTPGYSGSKSSGGNLYSTGSGWPINNVPFTSGHINTTTGVFTCPIAGMYAVGFNGIANGGSEIPSAGISTYGYAGFAKNGALAYWIHWNTQTSWNNVGGCSIFQCAVNDTLAFFINQAPAPTGTGQAVTYNYGWYPGDHHAIWCLLIG